MISTTHLFRGLNKALLAVVAVALLSQSAVAQFDAPGDSGVSERITGLLLTSEEAAFVPEGGDQIGALFGEQVVGRFVFTSDSAEDAVSNAFDLIIFGDREDSDIVEGPRVGQRVTFAVFDVSGNRQRPLSVETPDGESFTYTFQGALVPPLPIELPGLDLRPTRNLNFRVGVENNNGSGGGVEGDRAIYDVNQDGKIDVRDAAAVLRIVTGSGSSSGDAAGRADVNGDGSVTTSDAIEILTNR